jgi:signal peptidase II
LSGLRALAAGLVFAVLLLNFVLAHWLASVRGPLVLIPGLLDFIQTWNRGVSFSLFWQDGDKGRYVLIAVLASVVLLVAVLAWRSTNRLQAAGYGLVIGGALGNLIDRGLNGAVFDYLFLHLGPAPLFVFNFPDVAISAGVLLLAADTLKAARAVPDS